MPKATKADLQQIILNQQTEIFDLQEKLDRALAQSEDHAKELESVQNQLAAEQKEVLILRARLSELWRCYDRLTSMFRWK